jgi:hypothetical protein
MTSCPAYTNKQVKDEFNEIIKAYGGQPMSNEEFKDQSKRDIRTGINRSAMIAAYKVWDLTQGNGIRRTPLG